MTTIDYHLNSIEYAALKRFTKKHKKRHKGEHSVGVIVSFAETGISLQSTVKCSHCGKEKNITDYNSW